MGVLGHFLYRPSFGAKGLSEWASFDSGLVAADEELWKLENPDEIHLTPKASSSGPEGTIFYCSSDNSVYVGTE